MNRIPVAAMAELVEAAANVVEQTELETVLKTSIAMARRTTGARYAALGVIGEHGTLTDFLYVGIEPEQAAAIGHLPVGKGVLGTLVRDPHPIRLERVADHPDSAGFPPNHPPMETFLGVPIRAGDTVFGNLYLTDKPGGFTEEDELLVQALAAVVGSAISAVKLHEQLRRLALVEDRERIARDLHDAVIQDLFAVGLSLQGLSASLSEERVSDRLDEAVDRIDQAIGSLRSFIFDLRSLEAAQADPAKAFRRMAERMAASRGIEVHAEVSELGIVQPDRLDDALLIAREAISNAVRHGGAEHLHLRLHRNGQALVLAVEDDGQGFDPATSKRGMGLENMTRRAERSGGELELSSSPGRGTKVVAQIRL